MNDVVASPVSKQYWFSQKQPLHYHTRSQTKLHSGREISESVVLKMENNNKATVLNVCNGNCVRGSC
jgi:hypothetical protein